MRGFMGTGQDKRYLQLVHEERPVMRIFYVLFITDHEIRACIDAMRYIANPGKNGQPI